MVWNAQYTVMVSGMQARTGRSRASRTDRNRAMAEAVNPPERRAPFGALSMAAIQGDGRI